MSDRLDGLKFLRAIRDGSEPSPALARLLKFNIVDVSEGKVTFEATPSAEYYNYAAIVHGGFTMALLDSALGSAVKSVLAAGSSYRTVDLHARLLRPITKETGMIKCEGRVVSVSRSFATAAGEIVDRRGRLLATGTASCAIRPDLKPLRPRETSVLA
jgi:uncharacterized protein (TIGR00369 family)